MLSVDKIHKCKRYSLSTRTKTGFEYTFTEKIYEISLCWEKCFCDVSPMIIQGAWTRPMPGQPEENLLKSFSQTIYLQLCISIIHWNKYHVNQYSAQPRWKGKTWPHGISKLSPAGWKCLKQSAKVSARAKWCLQGTLFRHAAYGAPHPLHALILPSMLCLLWCWITAKKTSQFFGCAPYSTYSVTYCVQCRENYSRMGGRVSHRGAPSPIHILGQVQQWRMSPSILYQQLVVCTCKCGRLPLSPLF